MIWPSLRFLHFTDCHFSDSKPEQESWRSLLVHLERESQGHRFDCAFFSGDISDKNCDAGYLFARDFIAALAGSVAGGVNSIAVVPGNHDVSRDLARALTWSRDQLHDYLGSPARLVAEMPFKKFMEAMAACRVQVTLQEQAFAIADGLVRVLPFNTAWLARDTMKDRGRLSSAVERWERLLGARANADAPLTIALLHHSPDWLHEAETTKLERLLCKHVDLVLSGHVHEETHKKIEIDGYSSVLVTGASIGDAGLRFHRALLGELNAEGVLWLHRIVRDPYRTATTDEWSTVRSTIPQRLIRVDEVTMRETVGAAHSPVESVLRAYWAEQFEKNILIGFAPESTPRNLLVTYRRLTFAQGADEAGRCNLLWSDLQRLLAPAVLGEIGTRARELAAGVTLQEIDALCCPMPTPRLSGDVSQDVPQLARFVCHVTAMRIQNRLDRSVVLPDRATLLRALAITPELIRKETLECVSSVRARPELHFISSAWLLLYLLQKSGEAHDAHEAIAYAVAGSALAAVSRPLDRDMAFRFFITHLRETLTIVTAALVLRSGNTAEHIVARLRQFGVTNGKVATDFVEACQRSESRRAENQLLAVEIVTNLVNCNSHLCEEIAREVLERAEWEASNAITIRAALELAMSSLAERADKSLTPGILVFLNRAIWHSRSHDIEFPVAKRDMLRQQHIKLKLFEGMRGADPQQDIIKMCAQEAVNDSHQKALRDTFSAQAKTLEEVRAEISSQKRPTPLAIIGGPGSGKTTLLRHLCLTCEDELPIYVPLKAWNTSSSLTSCIGAELAKAGVTLEKVWASRQRVVLLLDGLDEVRDMTSGKQAELDAVAVQYLQKEAHVFITTRASAARWLPFQGAQQRYSLNRLTEDDVKEFIRDWFADDNISLQAALSAVSLDAGLLEDLKTPFVLRMHCAMFESAETSQSWRDRTAMYNAIVEYLLDKRDRAAGLLPLFSYETKRSFLAALASASFSSEAALESFGLLETAASFVNGDRDQALSLVREIVNRSQILTKISETRYDFTHFTVREMLAVVAWSATKQWTAWEADVLRRNLAHESIPRFIVGIGGVRDRVWVADTVRRVLAGNPSAEFIVAASRLERFYELEFEEQVLEMRELISACIASEYVDLDDNAAVFSRMYHGVRDTSRLRGFIEDIVDRLVAGGPRTWRLLTLASKVRDEWVAHCLISNLGRDVSLDSGLRTLVAQFGPSSAGNAVRARLQGAGDVEMLRECLRSAESWARELEGSVRELLSRSEVGASVAQLDLLDVRRLSGGEDSIEIIRNVFTGLAKRIMGAATDGLVDARILEQIGAKLAIETGDAIRSDLVNFGTSHRKRSIDVARFPEIVEAINELMHIDVKVLPKNVDAHMPSAPAVIATLADGASDRCIDMMIELRSEYGEVLRIPAGNVASRFLTYVPSSQREALFQIIDDAWCAKNWAQGYRTRLRSAKVTRLEHVASELRLSGMVMESVKKVVERLPRRPDASDWPLLQYRFGALSHAVRAAWLTRSTPHNLWNICSEDAWERIGATILAT